MPKRLFAIVIVAIIILSFVSIFLLTHRSMFSGGKSPQTVDLTLFDKIITLDLIQASCKNKASFSFQSPSESENVRAYSAAYRFRARNPAEHYIVTVGIAKAGAFLSEERFRRLYKEACKNDADRGPEFLRGEFPSVGKRACREFFGVGPGGGGYGLTFTTGDGRFDIRIAVSNLLPEEVVSPDPDLLVLARRIEARYERLTSSKSDSALIGAPGRIGIDWVRRLPGDFSFRRSRSIQSKAWCYEWAGTDTITAHRKRDGRVECVTSMNEATHCSLHMKIMGDYCVPEIILISVASPGTTTYKCTRGSMRIDRELWEKGVLKAEFNFDFHHPEDPDPPMYWKGRIYTNIN